jgi:hypothetical protein
MGFRKTRSGVSRSMYSHFDLGLEDAICWNCEKQHVRSILTNIRSGCNTTVLRCDHSTPLLCQPVRNETLISPWVRPRPLDKGKRCEASSPPTSDSRTRTFHTSSTALSTTDTSGAHTAICGLPNKKTPSLSAHATLTGLTCLLLHR